MELSNSMKSTHQANKQTLLKTQTKTKQAREKKAPNQSPAIYTLKGKSLKIFQNQYQDKDAHHCYFYSTQNLMT